jgi:hypothetical protein
MKDFLQEYKGKSLSDIHVSLANFDVFRHLIRKHNIIHYPLGSSRLAVAYEYQGKHKNKEDQVSIYDK